MPTSSRGFDFHSQSPDRIPPSWLANPRNPAMSPHSRHLSHVLGHVEDCRILGEKKGLNKKNKKRRIVKRRTWILTNRIFFCR